MTDRLPRLPLEALHGDYVAALSRESLLLEAEPGAGKSTLAPLWTMAALADTGQIWLVQPRVLPAVSLARRLAELDGSRIGERVGYQIPFDNGANRNTRLVVMTPGILLQKLLADPELEGVAAVMLDEIHERSVDQDTAWALLQEAAVLREDLRLVLMSATPDAALRRQVAASLYSPGRCHPVTVEYCPARESNRRPEPLEQHIGRALGGVPRWREQTVLVFLPGWNAIERTCRALLDAYPQTAIYCLHSRVAREEQLAALNAELGPRVILATNIAETSLTIADVTLVIDSGLAREAIYDRKTGVTRLQSRRISAASAEQRRGRAGRVQPGHCVRLWAEAEPLAPQQLPEVRRCDALPLALRIAHWGTPAAQLPWLEAPGDLAMDDACRQLQRWGLLDERGAISASGRQVSALGTHPRIAALLIHSRDWLGEHSWLMLLALALHFDLSPDDSLEAWLGSAEREYKRDPRWQKMTARWARVLEVVASPNARLQPLPGVLSERLAEVFSERIAYRRDSGRYRLDSGVSVILSENSPWALVLQLAARGRETVGVGLPVSISDEQARRLARPHASLQQRGSGRKRRWVELVQYRMGGELIDERERTLAAEAIPPALLQWVRREGLARMAWEPRAVRLLMRARWAERAELLALPPLAVSQLESRLDSWLGGFLTAQSSLESLPLAESLAFYLGHDTLKQLDDLLPEQLTLPSGRRVAVEYLDEGDIEGLISGQRLPDPRIGAKLQEFFGAESVEWPSAAVPLAIEMLSPAGRPLAITRDLSFFWREVYPQVRREMRGRYAKHPWPEDPLQHRATAQTKNRMAP